LEDLKKFEEKKDQKLDCVTLSGNTYEPLVFELLLKKVFELSSEFKILDLSDCFVSLPKETVVENFKILHAELIDNPDCKITCLHVSDNAIGQFVLSKVSFLGSDNLLESLEHLYVNNAGLGELGMAEIAKMAN